MKETVKSGAEHITPQAARDMLSRNFGNRPISSRVVREYAAIMLDGRWELTSDAIALDSTGNLMTGQHRLSAIVLCGVSQWMMVTRGLSPASKRAHDAGRIYNTGDYAHAAGYEKHYTAAAAVARLLMYYEQR